MRDTFEIALKDVLVLEGEWSDHPEDLPTMKGITLDTYSAHLKRQATKEELKNIPMDHVKSIYRKEYWDRISGDELPRGVDYFVFDSAVNSGPGRGASWLQSALGVKVDGAVGPVTIAAAKKADPETLINRMSSDRLIFLQGLRKWSTFGKGWTRRVKSVTDAALVLSRIAAPVERPEPEPPKSGTVPDLPVIEKVKGVLAMGYAAKSITAFLTGLVGVLAFFIPGVEQYISQELIAAITVLIQTFLVYIVPNKITPEQIQASRATYNQ